MKVIIFDVDGVLTDGKFTYTIDGKISKRFGPDDSDALSLIENYINIQFVSGDQGGPAHSRRHQEDCPPRRSL